MPAATEQLTNKEHTFVRWEYHQCNIPKQEVWVLYNLHLTEKVESWPDINSLGAKSFLVHGLFSLDNRLF